MTLPVAGKKDKINIRERIRVWRSGRSRKPARSWNWVAAFKVLAVTCFLAASGAFLRYAEAYVKSVHPPEEGSLILVGVPGWANWDLKSRVAAVAGGTRFPLQDETATVVADHLVRLSWLDDVNVQVTHDAVRVQARWRKPIALIEKNGSKFYVDADLVVLDYMAMPHLPIVEVKGVEMKRTPAPGQVFDQPDLAVAVALILLLDRMDAQVTPQNPLLAHIASVDVTCYNGRKSPHQPHIVLHTKDGTQVNWGAELGEWAKYLEAKDDQKLAKLYTYYKDHGSLSGGAKYIDLRDPQDKVSQPIDKYRW